MPGIDAPLDLAQVAPARSAGTGRILVYPKADTKLYSTDSTGAEQLEGQEFPMLAPVRACTGYNNITQSGLQTIDGVSLAANDRVLCRGQTGGLTNGIWLAQTGAWTRALDADTAAKIARGTQVAVLEGTQERSKVFTQLMVVTTLGTDANHWRVATMVDFAGSLQYPQSMIEGQLFWDKNAKALSSWNGAVLQRLNGTYVCTSTTRPSFTGDDCVIYETDTKNAYIYQGGDWRPFGAVVVMDESQGTSATTVNNLDFVGAGVTVTQPTPGQAMITIPGGGGGGSGIAPVRMCATGSITVAGPGIVALWDGVTPANGDRVLLPFQSTPAQNGVYIFNGTGSAMTRATDADTAAEIAGQEVVVQSGTLYGGSTWNTTFKSTDTLGTTPMTWVLQNYGGAEPDWRSLSLIGGVLLPNAPVQIVFNTDQGGAGIAASSGRMTVTKAGAYHVTTSITINQSGASNQFIIVKINQWRGGSIFSSREAVAHTQAAGTWDVGAVDGIFNALAGDIFDVTVQAQYNNTAYADSGRCHFNAHQIATSGASSGDLTYGFRGTTAQSIPNAANATVLIDGTPDHTCGGISQTSSIVTLATAGVYQLQGGVMYNAVGANARVLLRIEGWSGADPAVGSGTTLCESDVSALAANYPGLNCMTQAYLPAGYRLRMVTYQASGAAVTLAGAVFPAKLNIRKISQGGQPSDTGWLRPGDAGGPTWGTGWTDNNPAAELVVAKRIGTVVKARGLAWRTSGSGLLIVTLPVGMRPARAIYRPALLSGTWAYLNVGTDGSINFSAGGAAVVNSSNAVGFDIEFDLSQP